MKTIKLLTLEMEHFKGSGHRVVEFGGRDMTILGENGLGKTTHYDAVSWVLFGRDSQGRKPGERDFNIKPNGTEGTGVMPAVTVVLSVDGAPLALKKVYREVWTKPRGSAEQQFSGNTTDYFIDGVPKKESDYKAYISAIVTEEQWRLLTDVYWFCRDMPWRQRRALLFDLCGVGDDAALLEERPDFAPLLAEMGNHTLEDCKTRLRAERVKVSRQLDAYPIRIDECAKTVSGISGTDFAAVRAALEEKQAQHEEIQARLSAIVHNAAAMQAENRRTAAANALAALENENTANRREQAVPQEDPRAALAGQLEQARARLGELEAAFERENAAAVTAELRLDDYRRRWSEIQSETWKGSKTCPACGQPLPAHKVESAKAEFAAGKEARQKALVDDSGLLKADIAERKTRMGALDRQIAAQRLRLEALTAQLEAVPEPGPAGICDLPGYAARKTALAEELRAADEALAQICRQDGALEQGLRGRADELEAEMDGLRTELSRESILADAQSRMEKYEGERRAAGAELSRLDGLLYLSDAFTRYKSERITGAVNALFERTRFRLFTQQLNGGQGECCDPLWEGRPYGTISEGERAKTGLDVINSLMRAYDLRLPVFIDKAGEITGIPKLGTQTIIMKALEGQKELKYL